MASIGDKLREAREKKKLSWEKVHKDTKIYPNILKALEEDRGDELLDPIYIKGFLKKYAQYLGLDSREIAEEYGSLHSQDSQPPLALIQGKKAKVNYRRLLPLFKILLIIALTILFIGYLRFVLHSISQARISTKSRNIKVVAKAVKTTSSLPLLLVAKDKPLILTVIAKRDSWMQVKSDGRVIFENVLSQGKEEKWLAKQKLELWVGNGEGLELILNGKKLGSPGKGVIKDILITRQGMKVK